MRLEGENLDIEATAEEESKKLYATPELTVHGTIEEITQFLAGGLSYKVKPSFPPG